MSSPDPIAHAVLEWQHRHPLALRLGPDAVHSIGVVALPFVRASESPAVSLEQASWQRLLRRPAPGDPAAFSEAFIEGISPAAAARFAHQHGVESIEGLEDWPQRRVTVDSRLAEAVPGGWPYERWLASAALDGPHGRHRVLISLRPGGRPAVLGQRHWDRRRLAIVALLPSLALAAWLALRPGPPPPAHPPTAAGSVVSAASAASALAVDPGLPATPASAAASAGARASAASAAEPASHQAATPADASSGPATAAPAGSEAPSEAAARQQILPDIRPRLGPQRGEPRAPQRAAEAAQAASAARDPVAQASASPAPPASQPLVAAAPRPSLRALPPGAPPVALVSPGFAKRSDAEAMLARMLEHAGKTLASGSRLEGEVFNSPQGHRAAVWPFASREEAQLINATMVARGWKTRAVDF